MGHPYRRQVHPIPPLRVLLPLAVVDTLVVVLPTAPWMCQPEHSFRMLLAPVVGLPIGLLLGVQTVLWHFLRNWWTGSKAEADAAFATVSGPPPEVSIREQPAHRPPCSSSGSPIGLAAWRGSTFTWMIVPSGRSRASG